MLRQEEIEYLIARIVARMQPRTAIIFGSYAKGTATIRSDIDLLLIKETELPVNRRAADIEPLLARSLIPLDVHVYTPDEIEDYGRDRTAFINTVLRTGRVVFNRDASQRQ